MRLIDADELRLSHCKECTLYPDKCLKENCDWDSIYHIDVAKTIEAIPVEYIKEWFKRDDDFWSSNVLDYFNKLYDDWRKENE